MSETRATRLPRIRTEKKPEWADVIDRFYADSFDGRTKEALLESAEAFAEMEPEEQAFHQAHLTFRQVQALADIHATLKGIQAALGGLDPKALTALRHLPGIRKALVVIAKGQDEMLDLLEGAARGREGDADADEDPADDENNGDEDTDLEEAMEVEEEDHGNGDALVPEVLPASARRSPADATEGA
ncbi:MAG: hypothetical protein V4850_01420 [Myxococcota bacterium]